MIYDDTLDFMQQLIEKNIYPDSVKYIFNYYGIKHQKQQLIQELGELIVALTKNDKENILEEMADVQIMLDQFKTQNKNDEAKILKIQLNKVKRQINRIKNEANND